MRVTCSARTRGASRTRPTRPVSARKAAALIPLFLVFTSFWAAPVQAEPPDQLRLGMMQEPPLLDPTANAAAAIDEVVYANVFEGLTRFGPNGQIRPGLASSWEVSEDGKTYLFHLRADVTFHDGSAFDAEDAVFSLERARSDDSINPHKAVFAGIEKLEAADPLTLIVRLKASDGGFPAKMACGEAVMVAPETADNNATDPVGTGPFQFAHWERGDHLTLTAFPGYWDTKPALQGVTFRFLPDAEAAAAELTAGTLDAVPNFPMPEMVPVLIADGRLKALVGATEGETLLAMNNRQPPLDNPKVREAIARAIDRRNLIDQAMFGYGTPIGTHFPPYNPDYVDLTDRSSYDPDKSRALLAEAGVKDLTLRLALPPPAYARRGGRVIASELDAVGIHTTITEVDWPQWLTSVFKGHDYDLTVINHSDPLDIGIYARPDYYFQYGRSEFAALMDQLEDTPEPATRRSLLRKAQEMLAEDHVNAYLFQLAKIGVADARLQGLWENAPIPANDLSAVTWTP
jgi:peptide/nickel transport system substrate-binding protein